MQTNTMKHLYILNLLFFLFSGPVMGQNIVETTVETSSQPLIYKGKVLDASNNKPLPFAALSVPKLGLGTASNADGQWKLQLPSTAIQEKLRINYLGYNTKFVSLSELNQESIITLEPNDHVLSEFVVTNKDFCKEMLEKAWKAIPGNYPSNATLAEGFYRETQRLKDSTFLYFNEAVLKVYKNTYKNTKNFGQIKVEKSRKNVFPGIDSINDVRFYGGPHFPNYLDIVFSRWDFINPSEYDKWDIQVADSYKDSLDIIYILTFKHRKYPNSNFQGKMYIHSESYAFIGFEFWRAGLSALAATQYPDQEYIPGMTTIKVGYTQQDNKLHLGYITYQTNGYNTISQKRIFKDIEYVTTSIRSENAQAIPFAEQFDYTDILSIQAVPYDSTYWKDYNILEESKMMQNQTHLSYQKEAAIEALTTVYNVELSDAEKTLLFLKKFSFDGGFAFLPYKYNNGLHDFSYNAISLGTKDVNKGTFGISTMDGLRFELNKNWMVFGRLSTVLYGFEQFQADLGMNYRLSLAPSGRWIFLDMGLAAATVNSRLELGEIPNAGNNLLLKGKMFDSNNLVLKTGNRGIGLKPSISLAVRMGKQYELFTEATWLRVRDLLFKKDYIQVKEKEGGWFDKKSVKIDWDDPALQVNIDGLRMRLQQFEPSPLNIRIGIRSGF